MNLNYEEHCGYVNFLVESNWSLKEKKKKVTTFACKEIKHLHSKEVGRGHIIHSLEHDIGQTQKYFRRHIQIFLLLHKG